MSIISDFFNRIRRKKLPEGRVNEYNFEAMQYDYDNIMEYMEYSGGIQDFFAELEKINYDKEKYYPSNVHGIEHTSRVTLFATILSKLDNLNEHDKKLLLAAARYHDVGRIDDRETKEHGQYGVQKIQQEALLEGFSKEDKKIISFVIEQHSLSSEENKNAINKLPFWKREKYSLILNYLKDADALDRVRIANKSAQLDPSRLRSNTSKKLVEFAHDNYKKFGQIINKYKAEMVKNDPILNECYELIKKSIINIDWIIENKEYLKDLYNRGILQDCYNTNSSFLDIIENENLLRAVNQVRHEDFEYLRQHGYNITYESFLEIVGSYKDGALEEIRSQGKLEEIFSLDTFKKYGREDNFEERLKKENISDKDLFDKINENATTKILPRTFQKNYMLYRNLYVNHRRAFELFTYYDVDISIRSISGIFEKIRENDVDILRSLGYKFSLCDLIRLSSKFSPEEYQDIISSGDIKKLFQYNPERDIDGTMYEWTLLQLRKQGLNISEEELKANYELYNEVGVNNLELFANEEIRKYSIQEIYPVYSKIMDAADRMKIFKNIDFDINAQTILDLLEFSQKVEILENINQNETDEIIRVIAENRELKNDPRLIEYITKRNKFFTIDKISDLLDYNRFCMNKILSADNISLQDARSKLINSLFNLDVPKREYQKEIEDNIVDELYFYQKYKKNGELNDENDRNSDKIDEAILDFIEVMNSQKIEQFKERLQQMYDKGNNYNYNAIMDRVNERLMQLSKNDVVSELNKTVEMLDKTPSIDFKYGDEVIPIKYLNGQDFVLDITTVMPKCGAIMQKIDKSREKIIDIMINRELNPKDRCTSLIDQDMIAHAMSALQDEELKYAYVPSSDKDVSIMGTHDLSTIRSNNGRVTKRAVQYRKTEDMIKGTTEEHNETVLNNVYPRYIVCFDTVSDIAIQKYKMIQEQYKRDGIEQDIEILLIDAKKQYIPQIEEKLKASMECINMEIDTTGKISEETLEKFFNKREHNLVLQTIQCINSTSYRDEVWNDTKNEEKLKCLADVLEKVGNLAPEKYIGQLISQVDFILERTYISDSVNKTRFYDHSYSRSIDVKRFENIKKSLYDIINGQDFMDIGLEDVEKIQE